MASRAHRLILATMAVAATGWVSLYTAGCTPSTPMTPSASAPFTQGEIDASFEDKGNGRVEVRVKHLGSPEKLSSAATTYVVWLTAEGGNGPQNVGAFDVDSEHESTFGFNTSHKKFTLAVTPEPAADVTAMTGRVVLKADVVAR